GNGAAGPVGGACAAERSVPLALETDAFDRAPIYADGRPTGAVNRPSVEHLRKRQRGESQEFAPPHRGGCSGGDDTVLVSCRLAALLDNASRMAPVASIALPQIALILMPSDRV